MFDAAGLAQIESERVEKYTETIRGIPETETIMPTALCPLQSPICGF